MTVQTRVEQWMEAHGLSYRSAGEVLGISQSALFNGLKRGTFGRLTVAKLVHLISGLEYADFLLPEERSELQSLKKRAKSAA